MKTIATFITITVILAITNLSYSGPISVDGKVIKTNDNKVTIRTSEADSIPIGSRVDLFLKLSENESVPVGEWKVAIAGNGEVIATPVDMVGPPLEGMTAKISFQEKKKQVQVVRQNHHNAPPISEDDLAQTNRLDIEKIMPELRGKEPQGQLLGIPFPEKSATDYMDTGNKYYYEKNYQLAMEEFKQCARMGNSECTRMLGLFFNNGFGVKKDFDKARKLYEESALKNNRTAIYNLGVIYANGKGVKEDVKKAHELFLKSANLGYPEAQFNLGAFYYNGMGVEKNEGTALKWFKKAADQNIPRAIYVVGQGHEFGWGIPKDISKALEYYKKAADLGDPDAIRRIASGLGEKKLEAETHKLFEALYENDLKTVKAQLSKGVNVNAKNDTEQTPLHVAQDTTILKTLILNGAKVNSLDGDGRTPIFNKEIEALKVLIEAGADIHHKGNKGNTLLMWYSYSGYLEGIKYLVSLGVNVNAVNIDGQTAHDIAEKFAHFKLLEYLKSVGAQPGNQNTI